jgi:putative hydrolase of the HAD superfamily
MIIFFDIDDTLLDHESAVKQAAILFRPFFSSLLTLDQEEFQKLWSSLIDQAFSLYASGTMSLKDARRWRMKELFAAFGESITNEQADERCKLAIQFYEQSWRLFPDVLPCLEELSEFPLGIITNGDAKQQRLKLNKMRLGNKFSTVVTSDEAGSKKPNKSIFIKACHQMGAKTGNCLYIGDSFETDALAGKKAGMKGIWLNRGRDNYDRAMQYNIPVIHSLMELPDIIQRHMY